jgi:hypothetical protein
MLSDQRIADAGSLDITMPSLDRLSLNENNSMPLSWVRDHDIIPGNNNVFLGVDAGSGLPVWQDASPVFQFSRPPLGTRLPTDPEPVMHSLEAVLKAIYSIVDTTNNAHASFSVDIEISEPFWMDVGYSIYLFKVGSTERAWPLLDQACQTAITSEFADAAGLCDMLTLLSPVNTHMCSGVRKLLYAYLSQLSEKRYGREHPIAVFVRHLGTHNSTGDLFERAMSYLQGVLITQWGNFHPISTKSYIAAVRMFRRNHQYEKAYRMTSTFLVDMQIQFGNFSIQARKAARELEHVLIAKEDYPKALEICYGITGNEGTDGERSAESDRTLIEDDISVLTMEDIAKIFAETNSPLCSIQWLERAAEMARKVWPSQSIFLQHILDKLNVMYGRISMEGGVNYCN